MSERCCFCPDGNPETTDPCMECGLPVCGKCSRGDAEWLCCECYEPEDEEDDDFADDLDLDFDELDDEFPCRQCGGGLVSCYCGGPGDEDEDNLGDCVDDYIEEDE